MKQVELVALPCGVSFNFRHFVGCHAVMVHDGKSYDQTHRPIYQAVVEVMVRTENGGVARLRSHSSLEDVSRAIAAAGEKWGRK